jgi:hypothetical protein
VQRCSFCGTSAGPFLEVEGVFTVLMCQDCRAARSSSVDRYLSTSQAVSATDPEVPAELLAHRDQGAPWLEWGCPVPGCGAWVVLPWNLEAHTTAEHPGWVATWEGAIEADRSRVVYRRVSGQELG